MNLGPQLEPSMDIGRILLITVNRTAAQRTA